MKYFAFILISAMSIVIANDLERHFTHIYQHAGWGKNEQGQGHSGGGSTIAAVKDYIPFVQQFIKDHTIKSVVDAGCGDWEFSRVMDWSGVEYIGYDIVQFVIEKNIEKYATDTISFVHGNCVEEDLPKADLLLCKDVLQHLDIIDIQNFFLQLRKYKYCLITNGATFNILPDLLAYGFNAYEVLHYWGNQDKTIILVDNR